MVETEQHSVTVIGAVLAGGRSTRMGSDKAALLLGDRPMAAWVRDAIAGAAVDAVVMAGGSASLGRELGIDVIDDLMPGRGPLSALHALMTRFDAVAVVPCDVPLISSELIDTIIGAWRTSGSDVAVAACDGKREPLVSVWLSATCLPVVERQLSGGDLAIHRLFDQLTTCSVESEGARLVNVNTAAEFDALSSGL